MHSYLQIMYLIICVKVWRRVGQSRLCHLQNGELCMHA